MALLIVEKIELKPEDLNIVITEPADVDGVTWSSATTYAVGTKVNYNGFIYQAVVENTNKQPDLNLYATTGAGLSSGVWAELSKINKYKWIDKSYNTQTVAEKGAVFSVEFAPKGGNIVYLGNVEGCYRVVATMQSRKGEVRRTITFQSDVSNIAQYRWEPIRMRTDSILQIPLFKGVTSIKLEFFGCVRKIGVLFLGVVLDSAKIAWEPEAKRKTFSKIIEDDFGQTFIQKGASKKTAKLSIKLYRPDAGNIVGGHNSLASLLARLEATEVLIIGDKRYDDLILYGVLKSSILTPINTRLSVGEIEMENFK